MFTKFDKEEFLKIGLIMVFLFLVFLFFLYANDLEGFFNGLSYSYLNK
jgi:hypothetical protein